MDPDTRRACEKDLVTDYHTALLEAIADNKKSKEEDGKATEGGETEDTVVDFDSIWSEYVAGGAGRFAWFVPYFRQWPKGMQFFQDQLAEFLRDHVKDPSDMPMPRV